MVDSSCIVANHDRKRFFKYQILIRAFTIKYTNVYQKKEREKKKRKKKEKREKPYYQKFCKTNQFLN